MEEPEEKSVNPGYALGQLAKAFEVSQAHPDVATRERAIRKRAQWSEVLKGMLNGALQIGSRTPVSKTPAWATLQVLQGGFATGSLLAEGPLQPHEEALMKRLAVPPSTSPRAALNSYYLTDAGVAELQEMLRTGHYRISVPEEGALLVVAWLLQQERADAAMNLLDKIQPFLHRLRFYPIPCDRPLPNSALVHLRTIAEGMESLKRLQISPRIQTQRESTLVWAPLLDRMVDLFLQTLNGPPPSLRTDATGRPLRDATGRLTVEGSWPCQRYPEGWREQAQALLADYRRLRAQHTLCAKPDRPTENFAQLRGFLETCVQEPGRLSGRDVGRIRSILAHCIARRGLPSSDRCRALRQYQTHLGHLPTRAELAPVVVDRLTLLPQDEGLNSLDEILLPVTSTEADRHRLQAGQSLQEALENKLRPCLQAPIETLVEQDLITSGEALAVVTPQITAQVASAGLPDLAARHLYEALYQAFRRRRSLLLLNLQSQVKFSELPWIKALEAHRPEHDTIRQTEAHQMLERIATLAITAFPQQILSNKLLQEIRALAESAALTLPLVEEVAADIFMGAFGEKFLRASQIAGRLLHGSLYARYYDIPYDDVLRIDDAAPARPGWPSTSAAFYALCSERAGERGSGSRVAANGTIIEQEQILTTHNLAALFTALDLTQSLQPRLTELAQHNFQWICRRHQQQIPGWKSRLRMVKNTAYAWRQMLFFLSLQSPAAVQEFQAWAIAYLATQRPEFQTRFQPAMVGLARAIEGLPAEPPETDTLPTRRFLGWTTTTHWLPR